jgi:hypothetical protein
LHILAYLYGDLVAFVAALNSTNTATRHKHLTDDGSEVVSALACELSERAGSNPGEKSDFSSKILKQEENIAEDPQQTTSAARSNYHRTTHITYTPHFINLIGGEFRYANWCQKIKL